MGCGSSSSAQASAPSRPEPIIVEEVLLELEFQCPAAQLNVLIWQQLPHPATISILVAVAAMERTDCKLIVGSSKLCASISTRRARWSTKQSYCKLWCQDAVCKCLEGCDIDRGVLMSKLAAAHNLLTGASVSLLTHRCCPNSDGSNAKGF